MSEINDSEDSGAPTQSSINRDMESINISQADGKEDMFMDASDELNNDNKEAVTPTARENDAILDEKLNGVAKQSDEIDNGEYNNEDDDNNHFVQEMERMRALLEQAVEEKEGLQTKYKEEMETLSREIYMKDKEIEGLNAKLMSSEPEAETGKEVKSQQYEDALERILAALGSVIDQGDLLGDSGGEQVDLVEKSTLALIDRYNHFLSEVNQLRLCLTKAESDFDVHEFGTVLVAARDELFELRGKEAQLVENIVALEDQNRKFLEQVESEKAMVEILKSELEKTKTEVEQEKMRCANTKEKLSMAVSKGKGLVQQRDALKKSLADKTSELEKCLAELHERSNALEAAESHKEELVKSEGLVVSLQESLSEKTLIIETFEHILSQTDVPEELQSVDIVGRARWLANEINELKRASLDYYRLKDAFSAIDLPENATFSDLDSRLAWLKESFYQAKDDINMLQTEISRTKEAACYEIDHLTASLSTVQQEKHYIKEEIDTLRKEYEEIVGKAHQISLDKDHLSASFTTELAEKDYIKTELDNLSTEYEKVVEKVHQLSSEKDQMIQMMVEAYGVTMEDQERIEEASYLPMLIDRCFGKMKEQTSVSLGTTFVEAELFEKLQSLFYVRDLELTLCEEILEEDTLVRSLLNDLSNQFRVSSQELFALKEEKDVLQKDLERSEEKSGLLREKLSMAVKKGKGLVQDRENLKLLIEEKKSEIEKLRLELQHEVSTVANCRDQISCLSTDLERIPKLESDLAAMIEGKDQLEKFLFESNSILQRVFESIDRVVIPVGSTFQEPVEKLNFLAGYIEDCLTAKTQTEQDLREVKEEANNLTIKLAEAEATIKSLEEALAVAKNDLSQLVEEKRDMEFGKTNIEIELQKAVEETHSQTNKFAEICEVRKSLEEALSLAENKISLLISEKEEVQGSRAASEMEMEKLREEGAIQASKLSEAYNTIKSLESALSQAEMSVASLTEQCNNSQVEITNLENELKKLKDGTEIQARELANVEIQARKSLEEALSLAENKISLLIREKEEVQGSIADSETTMEKLREEGAIQASRLSEAYNTIKSLESELSQAETTVASLTEQSNNSQLEMTNLDNELKKLKDETEIQARELADARITIRSLEDALFKAEKDFSALQSEKIIADRELSTLNSKLTACTEELAGSRESSASRSIELSGHLNNLQILAKDQSLLSTMKQCFDRNLQHLKDVDLTLKNTSEMLQGYPLMEDIAHLAGCFTDAIDNNMNIGVGNGEENAINADDVPSCILRVSEGIQLRNKILADKFEVFSSLLDELIAALLKKLHATKDGVKNMVENMESLKQNVKNLEMREQEKKAMAMLQNDVEILFFACKDAIGDLDLEVKSIITELSSLPGLENLNHRLHLEEEFIGQDMAQQEIGGNRYVQTAEKLLTATRKVQSLVKFFETTSKEVVSVVHVLQKELEDTRRASEKAIEERGVYQSRVFKLESDVEALEDSCREVRLKVDDYQAKEAIWKEKEAELLSLYDNLLMKEKEAEEPLLSASQLRTLLDKLSAIEIPLVESEDLETHSSTDVQKLFSVIDSFTELQNQINLLSYEKEELQSTLSQQSFEIEHLKEEIETCARNKTELEVMKMELSGATFDLEKIVVGLGGKEFIGGQTSVGMRAILPVLEKQVNALLLEAESSKSRAQELGTKLLGSQNAVDELSTKVKLLEGSLQGRNVQPEIVQERSIFEAPSASTGSEISEIEDVGSLGKKTISPVPSAAHVRIIRKGSADHLALNIDSESDRLINGEETDEEKDRLFKSLNTTGLIPKQGKLIADRVDGIWVSGSRVLSSRPRARLGFIAYCLLLHIWLLGTIV
ncbi:Leucine-rich repeat-containing protein [Hibiscus syriacus]|uniref:Leucine-rich repeat-containing protein n=1 Tax=Hibiscus syriacus TaxID=106335 RepID=A0A6A3CSH7_HIBSY|nr:Leucine-rich repeat-containing protein [Hibiscus syriacus]